jgi:hypothetical protein
MTHPHIIKIDCYPEYGLLSFLEKEESKLKGVCDRDGEREGEVIRSECVSVCYAVSHTHLQLPKPLGRADAPMGQS